MSPPPQTATTTTTSFYTYTAQQFYLSFASSFARPKQHARKQQRVDSVAYTQTETRSSARPKATLRLRRACLCCCEQQVSSSSPSHFVCARNALQCNSLARSPAPERTRVKSRSLATHTHFAAAAAKAYIFLRISIGSKCKLALAASLAQTEAK